MDTPFLVLRLIKIHPFMRLHTCHYNSSSSSSIKVFSVELLETFFLV